MIKVITNVEDISKLKPLRDGKSINEVNEMDMHTILRFNSNSNGNQVKAVIFEKKRCNLNPGNPLGENTVEVLKVSGNSGVELVDGTISESMSERLAYLPEERRNKIRQGILALMPESVVFSFHQDNKLAGVIVLVDYTQHSTLNTLISWVWIKNRVDNNVKLFIKQKLVNVLIENSRENIIASVYTSNIRSLFFFTKLGFNLRWIYVE